MGDDEPCKIVRKGKVYIKLNNGSEWMLRDVRHIPAMKINLTSTRSWEIVVVCLRLEKSGGRSLKEIGNNKRR